MNKRNKILIIFITLLLLGMFFLSSYKVFAQENEETVLWRRGNSLILQGNWQESINVFNSLLSRYPHTKYPQALFWRGYASLELKRYQTGINDMDAFAAKNPDNPLASQALFKKGEALEKGLKQYQKALEAYEKAAFRYPDSAASLPAMQSKANIYQNQIKDFDKAEEEFERSKTAAQKQGLSEGNIYIERAAARIRFIRENSDYDYKPLSLYTDGQNLELERQWSQAAIIYGQIREKYPDANIADDALMQEIICLIKIRNYEGARNRGAEFLKKYPESPLKNRVERLIKNAGG